MRLALALHRCAVALPPTRVGFERRGRVRSGATLRLWRRRPPARSWSSTRPTSTLRSTKARASVALVTPARVPVDVGETRTARYGRNAGPC
eukprot:6192490-Pleurochrysis_carterae.AAC.3